MKEVDAVIESSELLGARGSMKEEDMSESSDMVGCGGWMEGARSSGLGG